MRKHSRLLLAIVFIVLAIAAGAIDSRIRQREHADIEKAVKYALSQNAHRNYIAQVSTVTEYCGKPIKVNATVFRKGFNEKIKSGRSIWSMTKAGKSYTYLPNENKLLISEAGKILSDADRTKLLFKNYRVSSEGSEKIAGRDTYKVKISSRFSARSSKRLWIDKQHFTILKSIDYTANNKERGSTETQKIIYNAKIPANTFAIPTAESIQTITVCESTTPTALLNTLGIQIHKPTYLPTGYKLDGYQLFTSQCGCSHQSIQLTYTDGLNAISVFQTPKIISCTSDACKMKCNATRKTCAVESCDIACAGQVIRKDRTIVVVGDLTKKEIRKIAESVK